MDAEGILNALGAGGAFERRSDGYWVSWPGSDVRGMAELMRANGVRFVMMTGMADSLGGMRLIYHWDVDGTLLSVSTLVTGGSIPTIVDIVPAADWDEREIRDYYGLEFEGRAETPTLMLREGDEPGLFSRTCDAGKRDRQAEASSGSRAEIPKESQ